MPKGISIGPVKTFSECFEVLVFTNLKCACMRYKDPKQIFVSLPISLALGLIKTDTELIFSLVLM